MRVCKVLRNLYTWNQTGRNRASSNVRDSFHKEFTWGYLLKANSLQLWKYDSIYFGKITLCTTSLTQNGALTRCSRAPGEQQRPGGSPLFGHQPSICPPALIFKQWESGPPAWTDQGPQWHSQTSAKCSQPLLRAGCSWGIHRLTERAVNRDGETQTSRFTHTQAPC